MAGPCEDNSSTVSTKQMFSCTHCEKMFEMRIKLNRHIANYHNREDDFDFTKPGIELTDDQKVKYFDKLREKFKDLTNKVLTKQALLKSCNKTYQSKVELGKAKAFQTDEKVRVKMETSRETPGLEDIELPPGWKVKAFDKAVNICSPGGVNFKSVHGALRHLVKTPKTPEVDAAIAIFRSKLLKDGWHSDSSLPDGWLTMTYKGWTKDRRNSWTRQHFLTPQFDFMKGQEEVVRWLRSNGAAETEVRAALGSDWIQHPRLSSNWLYMTNHFGNKRLPFLGFLLLKLSLSGS